MAIFLHSIFLKWRTVNVFHFAAFFPLKSAIIWHLTFGKTPSITPYMQESRQHRFAMSKYWVLAISMSNFIMLRAFLLSILIILLFRLILWDLLSDLAVADYISEWNDEYHQWWTKWVFKWFQTFSAIFHSSVTDVWTDGQNFFIEVLWLIWESS